jgi:hypothetical protein
MWVCHPFLPPIPKPPNAPTHKWGALESGIN